MGIEKTLCMIFLDISFVSNTKGPSKKPRQNLLEILKFVEKLHLTLVSNRYRFG